MTSADIQLPEWFYETAIQLIERDFELDVQMSIP